MNVKRFRTLCNISSVVLFVLAILSVVLTVYTAFQIYAGNSFWFNYNGPSFALFTTGGGGSFGESETRMAASIVVPIRVLLRVYVYLKGSQLFPRLVKGEPLFAKKFAQSLQRLSLVLIIAGILLPILYSLVLTTLIEGGYYLTIGVENDFLIGVILYAISEIFYYGIELQHLADETV